MKTLTPYKILNVFILLLFFVSTELTAQERWITSIDLEPYIAPNTLIDSVADYKFDTPAWSLIESTQYVKNRVVFEVDGDNTQFADQALSYTVYVWVDLWYADNTSHIPSTTVFESITVDYDPDTENTMKSRAFKEYSGAHKMRLRAGEVLVSDPNWNENAPGLKLHGEILIERKYFFDCNQSPIFNSFPGSVQDAYNVEWQSMDGAEEYDLEWTFYDEKSEIGQKILNNDSELFSSFDFLFLNNSNRITKGSNSHEIQLLYPKGYLFFRVRGARLNEAGIREYGRWSSSLMNSTTLKNFDDRTLVQSHNDSLNWQASQVFAEQGKNIPSITYFDGSLRSRQQVTLSNEIDRTIIGQTLYDFHGRPTVNILPTPSESNVIQFDSDFANIGADPFTKDTFDSCDCDYVAPALNSNFGAAKYYSPQNPDANTGMHQYIPDAEGYVYSQTQYMPDPTGRVLREGGVGMDFRLGGGKETVHLYGRAAQEELDRLFGNDVGYEEHYFKNIVLDPNGQGNASYLDAHGRVIATALVGDKPEEVEAIDTGIPTEGTLTINLLNNISDGESLMSTYALTVIADGSVPFDYSLDQLIYHPSCLDPSICYDCLYDLEIKIADKECNLFNGGTPYHINLSNFSYANGIDTLCSGTNSEDGIINSFSLPLSIGQYTVTKTLRLAEEPIEEYTEHFLNQSSCIPTLEDILPGYLNAIDTIGCTINCDSCLSDLGSFAEYEANLLLFATEAGITVTTEEAQLSYNRRVEECDRLCGDVTDCDIYFGLLENDVSPGGQYAEFDIDPQTTIISISDETSIFFNDQYQNLPNGLVYLNEDGLPDSVLNAAGVLVPPTQISIKAFIDKFKSSWAPTLVEAFHPEYCLYKEWCEDIVASDTLNFCEVISTLDTWMEAFNGGYADPTGVINDPFYIDVNGVPGPGFGCIVFKDSLLTNFVGSTTLVDYVCVQIYGPCHNGLGSGTMVQNDLAWNLYKTLYLGIKQQVLEKIWETLDNECLVNPDCIGQTEMTECGAGVPNIWANKIKRFFTFNLGDLSGDFNMIDQDSFEAVQILECGLLCETRVDDWLWELGGCMPISSADSIALRERLIAVCQEACDLDHLNGASTTPPGVFTVFGDNSFEDIILDIIVDAEYCDTTCSPLNISTIFPYDVQPYVGTHPINTTSNNCICENLEELETCYQGLPAGTYDSFYQYLSQLGETTLQANDIDSLIEYCNNDKVFLPEYYLLPPYLECNSCKTCDEVEAVVTVFNGLCSPSTYGYKELRALYLNQQLGFNLFEEEYDSFLLECSSGVTLCPESGLLCPTSGQYSDVEEGLSCYDLGVILAEIDANIALESILDSLRQSFRDEYRSHCLKTIEEQELEASSILIERFKAEINDLEYHRTLYYYDQAGNLVQTVPPDGVHIITNPDLLQDVGDHRKYVGLQLPAVYPQHNFYTKYIYNTLGQVIKEISPDAEETEFWYDDLGRLVFSQDGRQRNAVPALYSYSIYDNLGRIIEVGEKEIEANQVPITADDANNPSGWVITQNVDPAARKNVIRTYYDEAPFTIVAFDNSEQLNLRTRVASVTYEKINDNIDGVYDFATHYTYDVSGNAVSIVQEMSEMHPFGHGFKRMDYDFDYHSGKINAVYYQKGQADQFTHRYEYDEDNRLVDVFTSFIETDAKGLFWDRDASYEYYDHGPLARTELGHHNVQGMDYAYTLQGWIKGVNSSGLVAEKDMGKDGSITSGDHPLYGRDAFGYTLGYFNGEYQQIGTAPFEMTIAANSNLNNNSNNLYNGNIRYMSIHNKKLGDPMAFAYIYDQLHRIKSMQSYDDANLTSFEWGSGAHSTGYSMNTSYDGNGNIQHMLRTAQAIGLNQSYPVNDISYNYKPGTNLLEGTTESADQCIPVINVADPLTEDVTIEAGILLTANNTVAVTNQTLFQSGDEIDLLPGFEVTTGGIGCFVAEIESCDSGPVTSSYIYDESGNLIQNADGATITWNAYGKVMEVNHPTANQTTTFSYDPAQNRSVKAITNTETGVTKYTYYVRDADGNVMGTYERTNADVNWKEQYIYGSSRVGSIKPGVRWLESNTSLAPNPHFENEQSLMTGWKGYELTNHLSNVMAVVNDRKQPMDTDGDFVADFYEATVLSANDYYPFGLEMVGRTYSSEGYRYGFNGKEKDEDGEWGTSTHYDYGFRIYDPTIARFLSVDPLTKSYPWYTPYQFAGNKPIWAIDLDGLEESKTANDEPDHLNETNPFESSFPEVLSQPEQHYETTLDPVEVVAPRNPMGSGVGQALRNSMEQYLSRPKDAEAPKGSMFPMAKTFFNVIGKKLGIYDGPLEDPGFESRVRGNAEIIAGFHPGMNIADGLRGRATGFNTRGVAQTRFSSNLTLVTAPLTLLSGGTVLKIAGKLKSVSPISLNIRGVQYSLGWNYGAGHGLSGKTLIHWQDSKRIFRIDYHNLSRSGTPIYQKFLHYHHKNLRLPAGVRNNSTGRHLQFGTGVNIKRPSQLRFSRLLNVWY